MSKRNLKARQQSLAFLQRRPLKERPFGEKPAYMFLSRYAGKTPEQIEVELSTRDETPTVAKPAPVAERRMRSVLLAARDGTPLVLAEGVTTVREDSLRGAILAALRANRGTMTLEELARELKTDPRPAVAKLKATGWIKK
jgi:hypothetical protein